MNEVVLRLAQPSDAAAIQRIYGYYVENTAITCEVAIPSLTDLTERIKKTQQRFPYLIATLGDQVVGFAYVSPANPRYAYQWTVETHPSMWIATVGGSMLVRNCMTCLRKFVGR